MKTKEELLDSIVQEIESWSDGIHFKAKYDSDGDGRFDFEDLSIKDEGKKRLRNIIDDWGQ